MSKRKEIRAYILAHPGARLKEVADACGVSRAYVSVTRQQYGMAPKRADHIGRADLTSALRAQPDTLAWLKDTQPKGVDMAEHIVSILTDAMMEERDG